MAKKTKLKVGDKVIARFLGTIEYCTVIEVTGNKYKLQSTRGTIFPSSQWEELCERDKNGNIKCPWYIEQKWNENEDIQTKKAK